MHASNVWFGDLGVWVPPVGDHADVDGAGERLAKGFDAMICEARVVSEAVKKKTYSDLVCQGRMLGSRISVVLGFDSPRCAHPKKSMDPSWRTMDELYRRG